MDTPADVRALARVLGALLPWRTLGRVMDDPHEAYAVADTLETACLTAGVGAVEAVIIADSLAGYVLGWAGRYGTLDDWTDKGSAVLNLAMGGTGDEGMMAVPEGEELTDAAIVQLIAWALLIDLSEPDTPPQP